MNAVTAHPLRPIRFGGTAVDVERRADGTVIVRPREPLADYPDRLSDRFVHWAEAAPIGSSWPNGRPTAAGAR